MSSSLPGQKKQGMAGLVNKLVRAKRGQQLFPAGWPTPSQRQVDCDSGNRDCVVCPTCGESFQAVSMLQLHCKYTSKSDEFAGIPPNDRHHELNDEELQRYAHEDFSSADLQEHLTGSYFEVIVLVEGIEPTTSSTLQARHSYLLSAPDSKDLAWDMDFAECCKVPQDASKGLTRDFGCFHTLVERV